MKVIDVKRHATGWLVELEGLVGWVPTPHTPLASLKQVLTDLEANGNEISPNLWSILEL